MSKNIYTDYRERNTKNMKKIGIILIILIMAFGVFQTSYAGADKAKGVNAEKEEIVTLGEQIKQNNDTISTLRAQVKDVTTSIKTKATKLSAENTVMTQAEAADLKTAISIITSSKQSFKEAKADGLKQRISDAKAYRENKELDKAKDSMKNVLVVQENRIQALTDILNQLKTADQLLSNY